MAERAVAPSLIPHHGTARLVETIVDGSADGIVCRGSVPPGSAFASGEGRVPAVVALELAAQAAAVHRALESGAETSDRGYLVSVRGAVLHVAEIAAGVPLRADVRLAASAGPLATYDVTVTGPGGAAVLTATLGIHRGR
jgi:predicted hotdog family 3-hydroxylacyl-ACP dehydratase